VQYDLQAYSHGYPPRICDWSAQTLPQQPSTATQVTPLLPEAAEPVTKEVSFKESWQTISLQDSGLLLGPVDGVVLSKIDLPEGCTRELLHMQWRPVDPIDVYVIRPDGIEKPPIGLFLLNYTFDTVVFRSSYWCNQAKQNHLAIIGFGSAFSVQRFHAPRTMKQWFVSELQESLATSTHDVQMILNYAQARKDLDASTSECMDKVQEGRLASSPLLPIRESRHFSL